MSAGVRAIDPTDEVGWVIYTMREGGRFYAMSTTRAAFDHATETGRLQGKRVFYLVWAQGLEDFDLVLGRARDYPT